MDSESRDRARLAADASIGHVCQIGSWRVSGIADQIRRVTRGIRRRLGGAKRPGAVAAPALDGLASPAARRLRKLVDDDQLDEAVAVVRDDLEARSGDRDFIRAARDATLRSGAISLQRRATALEVQSWPTGGNTRAARLQLGRWRETSTDWSPSISADLDPPREAMPGRVLHVLKQSMPHRQSGYSVRSMYVLKAQRQVGFDPVAVTALDFPSPEVENEDVVTGVRHLRLLRDEVPAKQAADEYLDDWANALAPVVVRERPEIVHVHSGHRGFEAARVALAVSNRLGLPLVYEVRGFFESLWSSDTSRNERGEVYERRRAIEAYCMREAAAVVTLSESMREDILARDIDPEKVFVVPNGVDTASFIPGSASDKLRQHWGLEGFVFGYVSNLDHYREGQELLIDAAIRLRSRGVHATALIVGDGSRREELERHAKQLGAGDAVVFTGRVPHDTVLDYYRLMDTFVVPRVNERAARLVTPLKPYEAMALGIPLVVSDLPALEEITGGGSRGRSFRNGDADDLTKVLAELAADREARATIGATGLDWVRAERDWSRNGERYREVYSHVLG